jgi:hypothetical protein
MIERRSNRRARNGRKTPKNVLFVFQNCTFRFADYIETMNIFKVEFIIYAPSDGVTAAQFRVCDGVDIIVMPQQYMKPNAWIVQKGKRRR